LIFPDSFIPVAEKTGQIQAIDHWVLKRAVETMARRPELNISVNLSANAMEDETILPEIQRLLEVWEIEANRLTLEITETVAVSSLLNATGSCAGFKTWGAASPWKTCPT
jgi:EAL domain-containing protein (putative c-di-GMP-specific phosphodiesterase class I)